MAPRSWEKWPFFDQTWIGSKSLSLLAFDKRSFAICSWRLGLHFMPRPLWPQIFTYLGYPRKKCHHFLVKKDFGKRFFAICSWRFGLHCMPRPSWPQMFTQFFTWPNIQKYPKNWPPSRSQSTQSTLKRSAPNSKLSIKIALYMGNVYAKKFKKLKGPKK